MTTRQVMQVFDQYQQARVTFTQMIADLASKPHHNAILMKARVLELLKPLLTDICPQIQQCAAVALGRLIYNEPKCAKIVLKENILPILLNDIHLRNKYYKKAILFVVRGLCKHDVESAMSVVNLGGLQALVLCLEDFEIIVKESAVWALGYLARHDTALAQIVIDSGAVPHLVICMQEPELTLKQVTVSALGDIAKHSVDSAQAIVDAGAIPFLAKNLNNQDEKLKRQILTALGCVATHSNELAEMVVEARIFPSVLIHMAHPCPMVRKMAATLVRDIVKHSTELAQLVANNGGVGALLEILGCDNVGEARIPAITALGFIAGQSDQIALAVLGCNGIVVLASILNDTATDESSLAATAWALGQIGKHSPEHSKAIALANIFPRLLALHVNEQSSADLRMKTKNALKQCLQKCLMLSALEPLIENAPPNILKYVLGQFSKRLQWFFPQGVAIIVLLLVCFYAHALETSQRRRDRNISICSDILPNDPKARRLFVSTGCLKKLQQIAAEPGTSLMEYISIINACFPEEIVRFYSPNYPAAILEQVEQYNPKIMNLLRGAPHSNAEIQTSLNASLNHSNISEDLVDAI